MHGKLGVVPELLIDCLLVPHRDGCSTDDILLVTSKPLKIESGEVEEPNLHALVIIERAEPDPAARHMRTVHANISFTPADPSGSFCPDAALHITQHACASCLIMLRARHPVL